MRFKIFSKIDVKSLPETEAIKELQNYQQLAHGLRTKYEQFTRVVSLIEDDEEAKNVSFAFSEFNEKFGKLIQTVNKYINEKEKNINLAVEKIREFDTLFNDIEPIYQKHKNIFMLFLHPGDGNHQEQHQINKQIIDQLNIQWSTLQNNLSEKIEKGLKEVLDLKLTLGVTGIFKDQIEGEIKRNRDASKLYFKRFMQTLFLIPVFVGVTYFIDAVHQLPWHEALLLRLSIALPLLWVAKWFSTNYTYAQLATIKFDHLNRLLGEGMPTIAKLVEADPKAQSEVYNRFAELILDINDLTSIAGKQPKHPVNDLKKVFELRKNISDLIK